MATGRVKGLKKVVGENITSSCTKSSGNSTLQTAEFSRIGNVATLSISIKATADVASGTDAWVGTIPSAYRPVHTVRGVGYSGGTVLVLTAYSGGQISARVVNSTFPNTWTAGITVTYPIE